MKIRFLSEPLFSVLRELYPSNYKDDDLHGPN